MEVPETLVPDLNLDPVDIRIGLPERAAAQEALSAHREARRIDNEEYERRWRACERAGTRVELLRVFADLPAPHPKLPAVPGVPNQSDDDVPVYLMIALGLALLLGLPVGVVVGAAHGAWWALAVPVVFSVAVLTIEHVRSTRN